jgi:hypothetical protein
MSFLYDSIINPSFFALSPLRDALFLGENTLSALGNGSFAEAGKLFSPADGSVATADDSFAEADKPFTTADGSFAETDDSFATANKPFSKGALPSVQGNNIPGRFWGVKRFKGKPAVGGRGRTPLFFMPYLAHCRNPLLYASGEIEPGKLCGERIGKAGR